MTTASPVLAYDRPLAPGTVRISRSGGAVAVVVATDSPRRAVYSYATPAAIAVIGVGVAIYTIFAIGGWLLGLTAGVILLSLGIVATLHAVRETSTPIVFTADPVTLRIQNTLESPPDRTLGVYEVARLQLGPNLVLAKTYRLAVMAKGFPDRPAAVIPLLVSPSFETLDKIGRTLAEAMRLDAPVTDPEGWRAYPAAAPNG